MSNVKNLFFWLSLGSLLVTACKTEERFPDIKGKFTGPIDIAVVGDYSYVLNSDFERTYNTGSIQSIDLTQSDLTQAHSATHYVPRMGNSLLAVDNNLVATFSRQDVGEMGSVEIYSLDGSGGMTTTVRQELDCSPIVSVVSDAKTWMAVACSTGELYVSTIENSDLSTVNLRLVRDYDYARRAMYIYESGGDTYLFAFPTDLGRKTESDLCSVDRYAYSSEQAVDSNGNITLSGSSNEVPDSLENRKDLIRRMERRYPYQMVILNLTALQSENFHYKELTSDIELVSNTTEISVNGSPKSIFEYANQELKFIYYPLERAAGDVTSSFDCDTASDSAEEAENIRFYRTNFWTTQSGESSGAFYLSQRGIDADIDSQNTDANNILYFEVKSGVDFSGPSSSTPTAFSQTFEEMFSVTRIAGGFNSLEKTGYPGDFEVVDFTNERFVFINQFRDEDNWGASKLYAIDAKNISGDETTNEPKRWIGSDYSESAYQFAIYKNSQNVPSKLLSVSFYGESVLVFDLDAVDGIDPSVTPTKIQSK